MSLLNKSMASKSNGRSLSPRVSRLLRESGWLILVGAALYLILIFSSYNQGDPGWSHSGDYDHVKNAGGSIGAWAADFLLYFFGISAWWWIFFFFATVLWSYRRIDTAGIFDRHSIFISFGGFLLLLLASSGLESLRFYSLNIELPYHSGGILGETISIYLSELLGFTGATLTFLILIAVGFSQFTGLSWVRFVEKIGEVIENNFLLIKNWWLSKTRKHVDEWIDDTEPEIFQHPKNRNPQKTNHYISSSLPQTLQNRNVPLKKNKSLCSLTPLNHCYHHSICLMNLKKTSKFYPRIHWRPLHG